MARKLNTRRWLIPSRHPWPRGGLQTRTVQVAKAALELGDVVTFMCFEENPYQHLATQFAGQVLFIDPPAINTRSIRPAALLTAWSVLRQADATTLFYCNTGVPDFQSFSVAARLFGIREVIVHHGTEVEFPELSNDRSRLFGIVPRPGLWRKELVASSKIAYRCVSLALFNNPTQLASWKRELTIPDDKCELWYPPIDTKTFFPCESRRNQIRESLGVGSDFVIGVVGRVNKQKSFDIAVKSLKHVLRHVTNAKLVIVGRGEEEEAIRQLAHELGIADRVMLLGERSDVADIMRAFDVFVLCSTEQNETLGIVAFEAMSVGVPVIASDLPGPRQAVSNGQCGIVVKAGNEEELATAVHRIASDDATRRSFIEAGLKQSQNCDPQKLIGWLLARVTHQEYLPATA